MSRLPAASPSSEASLEWSAPKIAEFRGALLAHFRDHRRSLSWRENRDPYRILVSEVMLQQTRVETVTPYFERWIDRFPDLESLALAEEEEVLRLWAGLGYYSRARRLQETVREVLARYDGAIPEDIGELRKLPGIGPYTAGAIASIAFGAPVPAVDGNVRRVLARLADVGTPAQSELHRWAGELVDPDDPGAFNQALMELGSLICLPRTPKCEECPVATFCAARKAGTERLRPTPPKRRRPPLVHEAVAVLLRDDSGEVRALLRRRPAGGLLGGMWEFPGVAYDPSAPAEDGEKGVGEVQASLAATSLAGELLREEAGMVLHAGTLEWSKSTLVPFDHTFSHKVVRYAPFIFRWDPGSTAPVEDRTGEDLRWVTQEAAERLPLPAAQRMLASRVWSISGSLKQRGVVVRAG